MAFSIFVDLIDEILLDICFDIHKKAKLGLLCPSCDVLNTDPHYDVFGQKISSLKASSETIECPNCANLVVSSRFAPHLEKCFGLGRRSRPPKRYYDTEWVGTTNSSSGLVGGYSSVSPSVLLSENNSVSEIPKTELMETVGFSDTSAVIGTVTKSLSDDESDNEDKDSTYQEKVIAKRQRIQNSSKKRFINTKIKKDNSKKYNYGMHKYSQS